MNMSTPQISDCRTSNFDNSGSWGKAVTYDMEQGSDAGRIAFDKGSGIFWCHTKGVYQFSFGGIKVSLYLFPLFLHIDKV